MQAGQKRSMASFFLRRWRRRATLRAWARGELEFAGALGKTLER